MCQAPGETTLPFQILKHTPLWVFGLFFGLAYVGYLQSKTRLVSRQRLAALPTAMLCLSFLGVLSSFGPNLAAFAAWTCALLAVVVSSLALAPPRDASYSSESRLFTVPGSWVPLAIMMCIFFTKYAVAVARAVYLGSSRQGVFTIVICAVYGLCSGVFLARALRVARIVKLRQAVLADGAEA
jgi:hypothetical protein